MEEINVPLLNWHMRELHGKVRKLEETVSEMQNEIAKLKEVIESLSGK